MADMITSTLKLGRKVSLVLWLIDQYTSLGCNEEVTVLLNGVPANFQRKAGGYLVFTDLEGDNFRISLESQYYMIEELEITLSKLNSAEPVVYIPLKPSPAYSFNSGSTLIRACLISEKGFGHCTDLVTTVCSDNCARAKLGRQGASAGSRELSLVDMAGRIAPGDLFLLRPEGTNVGEICEISSMGAGEGIYTLKAPLLSDHRRGELLMPVIVTRSDSRGQAVVAIRGIRQKEYQVQVAASIDTPKFVELTVKSGQVHQLGNISL